MRPIQRALAIIYPHQCVLCDAQTEEAGALCPSCWAETPFLRGHLCDACGAPLVGESDGKLDTCDACLASPRPWQKGRAAWAYSGAGRTITLRIKHSDRTDLIPPAADWMARAGRDILKDEPLLIPIPIHWTRRIRRRYNQSAELARAIGKVAGCPVAPDTLLRLRVTRVHENLDAGERYANQTGSMMVDSSKKLCLSERKLVLVDDVMTSGATLTEACRVLHAAGAKRISCLVLARALPRP